MTNFTIIEYWNFNGGNGSFQSVDYDAKHFKIWLSISHPVEYCKTRLV